MQASQQPATAARPLFDLGESEGVNESERILTKLCRESFLRLWSQTNVFTDEGFKNGKGATKELCDALVIFGNDVIVFSDKHCTFQTDKEIGVAWPRWYKSAIRDSCKQLHGAKSWLSRFPERAFLDAKCTRNLPIAIPTGTSARYHLVAVTRGSRDAVIKYAGGEGLGSLFVNSAIEGNAHFETPFFVGRPEPTKAFVHVFDEVSIELVMRELDTAVDFLDYLKARETLLNTAGSQVISHGEEELLAAYLRTMDHTGSQHVFFDASPDQGIPDLVMFDGSHYAGLKEDAGYRRKKQADSISYEWDSLIERFVHHGDLGIHAQIGEPTAVDLELGLRLMAAESRFRRRILAQSLCDALQRVEPGMRLARLVGEHAETDETVYVFLVMPQRGEANYGAYRQHRLATLHAYVRTARLRAPNGTTFVGIALDNPHKEQHGGSEDLLVYAQDSWSQEELAELKKMCEKFDLWKLDRVERSRYRQDEFPQASQAAPIVRLMPDDGKVNIGRNSAAQRKAEKRKKKAQQASKRRNRPQR